MKFLLVLGIILGITVVSKSSGLAVIKERPIVYRRYKEDKILKEPEPGWGSKNENKKELAHSEDSSVVDHPISEKVVKDIKLQANWTPMEVEDNPFSHWSSEEIKNLMGTKLGNDFGEDRTEGIEIIYGDSKKKYPEKFDGRDEFGKAITDVRNQSHWGSCWAFGAVTAFSDRYNIVSNSTSASKVDVNDTSMVFSPQDMVSCSKKNRGCEGGLIHEAWDYIRLQGLVEESCDPYTSGETQKNGTWNDTCVDGSPKNRYKGGKLQLAGSISGAKEMIMKGPVQGAFSVYEDFMNYKEGVYQHLSGKYLGGHGVKIIGWGKEDGLEYWLCVNSWGTKWGTDGYFKIKMGEAGIEKSIYASNPIISGLDNRIIQ